MILIIKCQLKKLEDHEYIQMKRERRKKTNNEKTKKTNISLHRFLRDFAQTAWSETRPSLRGFVRLSLSPNIFMTIYV